MIHARGKDFDSQGKAGTSGSDGNTCYRAGGKGSPGDVGGKGGSGQDVTLEINFAALGSLVVDVTGGSGGAGGKGGKGGRAGNGNRSSMCHGKPGGKGGPGGPGGPGGLGGKIKMKLNMSSENVVPLLDRLSFSYGGGKEGGGGSGGDGGDRGTSRVIDLGLITKTYHGGSAGSRGENGTGGQSGQSGQLTLTVSQFFGVSDDTLMVPSDPRSPDASDTEAKMLNGCADVASVYPRYWTMAKSPLFDPEVHRYVNSNLQKTVALEAMGEVVLAAEAYRDIYDELTRIVAVGAKWHRAQRVEGKSLQLIQNEMDDLIKVINNPSGSGCFAQHQLSQFNQCRSLCIGGSNATGISLGIDGKTGSPSIGISDDRKITIPSNCVPECMDQLVDVGTHAACGDLYERVRNLRSLMVSAEAESYTKPIHLARVWESVAEIKPPDLAWGHSLVINHRSENFLVCSYRDAWEFGIPQCRNRAPRERWQELSTCDM